jgi:hypothetical protein
MFFLVISSVNLHLSFSKPFLLSAESFLSKAKLQTIFAKIKMKMKKIKQEVKKINFLKNCIKGHTNRN